MQSLSPDQVEQIVSLRKQGIAYKKIAHRLNVSSASVHAYSKNIALSSPQLAILKQNEKKNQEKFVASHEKEIRIPSLDTDFANLLGHLFFDGSVFYCNGKSVMGFANASRRAVESFLNRVQKCFGLNPAPIRRIDNGKVGWFETQVYSKKAYLYLTKISSSYSTSQNARVPDLIKSANPEIKSSFLRAFWDDEGCISNDGYLTGFSKSEPMIDDLLLLHGQLGIQTVKSITKRITGNMAVIRIRRNKENYRLFVQKIGFEHATITKGHNIGKRKQDVLIEKCRPFYLTEDQP